MEIKDRIKRIIDHEGITLREFSNKIGIQQSTLSHVLNGRNNPSLDVITKIHQHFDHINLYWLLDGIGEMLSSDSSSDNSVSPIEESNGFPLFEDNSGLSLDSVEVSTERISGNEHKIQGIKYIEKPQKQITEIRIFFDDNTYEIFRPEK